MSKIMQAMTLLRECFGRYAGKEGNKDTLTKAELVELLRIDLAMPPVSRKDGELLTQRAILLLFFFFYNLLTTSSVFLS